MSEPLSIERDVHDLKARVDSLEQQVIELRAQPTPPSAASGSMASSDIRAFAAKLIEQIGEELDRMRPQDDGKVLGAMQDGVMHDGKGVAVARYQLPDGRILVWQRDDMGGFTLRVADVSGASRLYLPAP